MSVFVKRAAGLLALLGLLAPAFAATYVAPSGYFQIIGYKLQRTAQHELAVTGWVQALADCRGAEVQFDVLDRTGASVGTIRVRYGAFHRHDRWDIGPGEFTPRGLAAAEAIAVADHVEVRAAECT